MSKLRKITIWCVAVSAIWIVFKVCTQSTRMSKIVPPPKSEGGGLDKPVFDSEGAKSGSFDFYNEETKKLERKFGFAKLLNPGDSSKRWQVEKPYMSMYEDDFVCNITSEKGTVQVETGNKRFTPTNVELYDNVVIRIQSRAAAPSADTVIYMDTLSYNSERSEFYTSGPIKLVSEKAEMEGVGLVLIYNEPMDRIEFLKVIKLDYLLLKNVAAFSSPRGATAAKTSDAGSAKSTDAGEVQPVAVAGSEKPTVAVDGSEKPGELKAAVAADTADEKVKSAPSPDDFYECTFSRDVVIKYGDEIIVEGADEISIRNILWGSGSDKSKPAEGETSADSGSAKKTTTGVPSVASVAAKETAGSASTAVASASAEPAGKEDVGSDTPGEDKTAADAEGMGVEVYITCKGSLVCKPTTSVYDSTEPPIEVTPASEEATPTTVAVAEALKTPLEDLSGGVSNEVAGEVAAEGGLQEKNALVQEEGPVVFKTRSITYDMMTGSGWAQAPVELTFYPRLDKEGDPNTVVLPLVITAQKNVQFLANKDRLVERIIFNKKVIGTRKATTPLYVQTSQFFGEKLTVELNNGPKRELEGDISRIFVTEGNVKLESVRMAKERVISRVKLSCERFDYDVATARVYATGPGRIELNNANVAPVERKPGGKKPRLSGPCYALVRGFERLTWFTEAMQINADGKAESVYLAYSPIVDGELGDTISVTTMHLQANFLPMPDGTNELATVITKGGILYEEKEKGGNVFHGQNLHYDAETSLVKVTSTEKNDCFFNHTRVDWIEYELDTGDVKAELASSPGTIIPKRDRQ